MGLPSLNPGDLHAVFSDTKNRCVVWRKTPDGAERVLECEMRNATVNDGFGHHGWCPRGDFLLGAPSDVHLIPFGEHFTPLWDLNVNGPMHDEGRRGIGIHGGGSGLAHPFAPEQGWVLTHGCLRVLNRDNAKLVFLIRQCQHFGHKAYLTVTGTPGAGDEVSASPEAP